MKEQLIGKWIQNEGQEYPGLWFNFKEDGSFEAEYQAMGIESHGTYTVDGNKLDMDQTYHTFGFVGEMIGLFAIEGDQLIMAMVTEDQARPESLEKPTHTTHYTRG